jgi:hypothetical protein
VSARRCDAVKSSAVVWSTPSIEAVAAERKLAASRAAAIRRTRRIFVWPLGDEVTQLELFWERVVPLVPRV